MHNWKLDDFYKGFDEVYQSDLQKLDQLMSNHIKDLEGNHDDVALYLEKYLLNQEKITILARNLSSFASLIWATDVTNKEAPLYLSKLQAIYRRATKHDVIFSRFLLKVELDEVAQTNPIVSQYLYLLKREKEAASHLLSEAEEVLYAKLKELSSGSWSQLQSLLTANLDIVFRDKTITLPEIRNLAYDHDAAIRKEAYHLELKAYESVDDAVALALSNIKREVLTISELRGYQSPLDQTLFQSKMTPEILKAMMDAMASYKGDFASYLKAKAKYLGYETALPFYELFAPVGALDKTYTYNEAKELILDAFASYGPKLSDFAKKAFDNQWIDVEPKKGKRGGAFCSNQPQMNQSRIMLNFTGTLSDVLTLAHELGHGYHGDVIAANEPLFWSYPMPLAETASIFCETITNHYLLKTFKDSQSRLSVLENSLQSDTQVIIDILSRYYFETKLFQSAQGPINKEDMKEMMLSSQKEAYLDGLDHNLLHPYMWVNKPHYYSAGLNFYNFPYAFGLLFGKGLYAQYLKDPKNFLASYDALLALTTKADVFDVAKQMGIDITDTAFWKDSLELINQDIKEVIFLFSKQT